MAKRQKDPLGLVLRRTPTRWERRMFGPLKSAKAFHAIGLGKGVAMLVLTSRDLLPTRRHERLRPKLKKALKDLFAGIEYELDHPEDVKPCRHRECLALDAEIAAQRAT